MPAAGAVGGTGGGGGESGSWGGGGEGELFSGWPSPRPLGMWAEGAGQHPQESKAVFRGDGGSVWGEGAGRRPVQSHQATRPAGASLRVREAREASHAALGPHGRGLGGSVRALSEAEPVRVYIKRLIVRSWLRRLGAGKSEIRRAGQPGSGRRAGGGLLPLEAPSSFSRKPQLSLPRPFPASEGPPAGRGWPAFQPCADLNHLFPRIPSSNPPRGVGLQAWLRADKLTHDTHCHRGKGDAQAREVSRPGGWPGRGAGGQPSRPAPVRRGRCARALRPPCLLPGSPAPQPNAPCRLLCWGSQWELKDPGETRR